MYKTEEGFSLIELMVIVSVLALALGLGIPAFNDMLSNSRMSTAVNDLVGSLHAARGEAITRRASVVLCPANAAGNDCQAGSDLEAGWLVFVDSDDDGSPDAGEPVLQQHGPIDAGPVIDLATFPADQAGRIVFSATGTLRVGESTTDIQICDQRGDRDTGRGVAAGRWIRIQPTGQPEIRRLRAHLQDTDINPLGGC
ncbi:MAG: GspH/FimT family pseudopilin [Gammaproteobacteria bacterium]